jgi:cyclomaltodextrinase
MNPQFRRLIQVTTVACLALGAFASGAEQDFSAMRARPAPEWLRDGVIYEVFPRDFSPAGNLNGVTVRLDDLRDLGVTVVWLMPIHPIGEKFRKGDYGSPYSIKDYYAIDPNYGTVDDFKHLIAEAHKRGLKVIMDLVANHTAWDSVMMAHPEFYKQDKTGKIIPPIAEWTDVAGLNYNNQELRQYMIAMLKHWIQTSDVDGFRCDVASMVPTDFWDQTRVELEKIKPDIMMLAEASKPDLFVKAFDIDYGWPLLGTLNNVIMKGAPASDIKKSWEESRRQFPQGSLHMRISDDHDEARAVARYGVRGAVAASALMFSLDGVPLLYNGMEVGDATESGDPALFDKLTIFWQPKERPPLRRIYRELAALRKQYLAFRNEDVTWLKNSDENDVVTLMRSDDKNEFVVLVNFSNRRVSGSVEVNHAEEFKRVKIMGVADGTGFPSFRLNGFDWAIYQRQKPTAETKN